MTRLAQLDLLRGIAVLLVLGRHLPLPPESQTGPLLAAARVWQLGGWIGVDLFFVLSGFLVSGLLFQEMARTGSLRGGRFLIRRGFKIYPAFLLLLATTAVYKWIETAGDRPGRFPVRHTLHELFFVQNYLDGLWNHTWSLAVEEHFYLLLTLLFVLLARQGRGRRTFAILPLLFALVAAACLFLRWRTATTTPFFYITHLFPTHLRIDSLFFGVLLAYGWHWSGWRDAAPSLRVRAALLLAGVALLIPPFLFPIEDTRWLQWAGLTGLYLGSGAVLFALLHTALPDRAWVMGVATIGVFSYSIYLWHMPVNRWIVPAIESSFGPFPWWAKAFLAIGGAVAVGIGLGKAVEYPMLRLRDRWFPSRTA